MLTKQKIITVEVDGEKKEFLNQCWSPMKCFGNISKIGKSFAVPLSMLASGGEDEMSEVLPQALFMLFEQMEEQDVWELFQTITQDVYAERGTRKIDLDEDLGNDLGAILTVVGETLRGNYGSLFTGKGLSSLINPLMGVTQVAEAK
jgi:hypothetical protein